MNKKVVAGALTILAALYVIPRLGNPEAGPLEHRLVYVQRTLQSDDDVAEIRELAERAARHGLTGVVLASNLDQIAKQPPEYFVRLGEVKSACEAWGLDVFASIFTAGYGSGVLANDPNLAAAVPVRDALYYVRDGVARPLNPRRPYLANGMFEDVDGDHLTDFKLQDGPGTVSFVDRRVRNEGRNSVRMDMKHFRDSGGGNGRIMQEVEVEPFRTYRIRCWMRTDKLAPRDGVMVQVRTTKGRILQLWQPDLERDNQWQQVVTGFNSLEYDRVRIYAGIWNGISGSLWIDNIEIEEAGPVNILRRDGTPVTVKNAESGQVYEEGRDFEPVVDDDMDYKFDHRGPGVRLTPESRIAEGEKLLVSYYQGISINRWQVPICMAEPEVYRIWKEVLELVQDSLQPSGYLLAMDEVRAGGWCETCRADGMTAAERIGACISRQRDIIAQRDRNVMVMVWSDMLDPNHNAHDDYYLYKGDFSGSWQHIPRDLVIACWYYDKRKASLRHFDKLGFRTLAGAYYDKDNLDEVEGWLGALAQTPGACGIMYTTWLDRYELLEPFGDLVSGRSRE